ncbi:MAG: DksA/TraR family C4-type zinc finger protein [Desulfobulbus sp.]|jgi:phage/conjugal plasmid C-4 type zinc finger TraR family protein
MAGGWYRDGAVQEQIDASVEDAVQLARSRLGTGGESLTHCAECDDPIPEGRRRALPGVRLCVACQTSLERDLSHSPGGVNRRASKESQLK